MLDQITFFWPWVFAALALPLLVTLFIPPAKNNSGASLRFPYLEAMQGSLEKTRRKLSWLRLTLAILAWVFLVVAAARPQLIGDTITMSVSSRSLMLAVDVSGSMQERDMTLGRNRVDRLTAVKKVAGDFIKQREGDQIGLILFGDLAYLQTPLSQDRKTVHILLDEAQIGLAGKRTAIGDAIGLAVKRLREQDEKNRVLILLTDGSNTSGSVDPLKASDLAARENIRIYTIGVGGAAQSGPFGMIRGRSDIDEVTLQAIADKTGGRYFRANDTKSLQDIYALLDKIEPISEDTQSWRPVQELYFWPLMAAFLLTVANTILHSGWLQRIMPMLRRANSNKSETRDKINA